MIERIIQTLENYVLKNNKECLSTEEEAEIKAEIEYLKNFDSIEKLNKRIAMLQDALIEMSTSNKPNDYRISRKDFIEIYNKCVCRMFDSGNTKNGISYEDVIYSNAMTIHWNGMYCDLTSGACIANHIIPGIMGVDEEDDEEEYDYTKEKENKDDKD